MAEVDPRILALEREAAKTLASMKRAAASADRFELWERQTRGVRQDFGHRASEEVRKGRVQAGTVAEPGTKPRKSLEDQSRATRQAAREQDRMTGASDRARSSEARLTRQRAASTRALLTQEQAVRRYGQYAGGRFLERQAARYYADQPLASAAGGGRGGLPPIIPPGGAAPPPPPPPRGPGGGGPRGINPALVQEQKNLAALESQLAKSTRSHQRLIQVQASGSNALRRHGALTTEFITAAARGEVTIRELGYQTTATIGKFGGWITAGAVLYGALGAVQQMGRGALDAYSGVNQLQRVVDNVDASAARKEFSALADEFQLPFKDVTEGAYEMGKVFHDQNTALEASKALLYSVKVGELDTATAGRYLIAITNAYNLSAQDLNATFDKFNTLQNQYGVSISGIESATSRAAGSFVNAGGSLDYLIALIGTAARITGAAPERIGTALQRAPNFLAKPQNESILRSFGIDPAQSIEAVIDQAFEIAKRSSGRRRRELASAIFGPQYGAAVGTPLLRQFDLFRRIQGSLTKSQGSGAQELARLKESPEEQLKNIGIQLQRLGEGLAESGLISLLAGTVLALDDIFRITNSIVGVFNDLPGPLKESLGVLIQLGIAARLLSRLNVSESFLPPGQRVGAIRTFAGTALGGGDRKDARSIRKGLYDERGALETERAQLSDQAREKSSRAVLADERAVQEQKRLVGLQSRAVGNEKSIAESRAAVNTYVQEANSDRAEAIRLSLDEENKARRLNQVNRSITQTKGRFGVGLNVPGTLKAADQRTGYYPTSFGVPTTERPRQYPPGQAPAGRYGAVIPAPGIPALPLDLLDQEKQMRKAEQAATRQTRRLRRVRPSAAGLGNAFNRLIGGVGNLIFAAFTIGFIAELVTSTLGKISAQAERADAAASGASASNAQKARAAVERVIKDAEDGQGFFGNLVGDLYKSATDIRPVDSFSDLIDSPFGETKGEAQDDAELARRALEGRLRRQRKARRAGRPAPLRYADDIRRDIEELQSSGRPSARARELLDRYDRELLESMEARGRGAGGRKGRRARLRAARDALERGQVQQAGERGLESALEGLNPDELQAQLEAEITQAGFFGGLTRNRLKRASTVYSAIFARLSLSRDPEDIQNLAAARASFFDGIQQNIESELDDSLALARGPGQISRSYTRAFRQLRQALIGDDQQAVRQQRKRVESLQRQLREGSQSTSLGDAPGLVGKAATFLGLGGVSTTDLSPEQLRRLRVRIQGETDSLEVLRREQRERRREHRLIQSELRRQAYEIASALREAQTQLRVSRTADPLKQARIKLTAVNTEIGKAIEVFGRSSKEVLDLLSQRQEILAQQAQEQLNRIDAQGSLRAAALSGEGNEIPQARAELQTLRSKLAYSQANASRFNPAEIIQLQADIRSAEIDLAEQVEERAEELALAAIDIRIARAEAGGNELRSARLNVARSQYELSHADTPLERRQSRADLIGKRASLRDATAQRAIEDIQFQADIGKLTLDQQISSYQRILSTMKLTRDMRRDLRRRIYQLRQETENEAGFDLNVGNIKLPTIYEIRRAVQGGASGGVNVNQRNTYHIRSTDPQGAAAEISRLNGGANKAAMRSAGVR